MTDQEKQIVEELVGPIGLKLLAKVCEPYQALMDLQAGVLDPNLKKSIDILSKLHSLNKSGGKRKDPVANIPGPSAKPIEQAQPVPQVQVQPKSLSRKGNALDTTVNQPEPIPNSPMIGKPRLPGIGGANPPKLPGIKQPKPKLPGVSKAEVFLTKSQLQVHCKKCGSAQIDNSGYVGCFCQPLTKSVQSTPMPMGLKLTVNLPKDQLKELLGRIRR